MKPLDVDLDVLMGNNGRVGKYQIKHFLWTLFPVILSSLHATTYVFTVNDTSYRCHVPECEDKNGSDIFPPPWIASAIPFGDKCSRYSHKPENFYNNTEMGDACSENHFDKNSTEHCTAFIFESNNTFLEEMNIPCQDWKRTLVGTLHSIGTLISLPIVGIYSDKFGRRNALVVSSIMEGVLGIIKSLSVNYPMFLVFETLEPVFGSGSYSSAYILALELLTPSTRVIGGAIVSSYFSIGQIIMGFVAWKFQYWRTFLQVIYAPAFLAITLYWALDESVRWLISKRKYQQAMETLKKIAAENDKTITEKEVANLQHNIENVAKFDETKNVNNTKNTNNEIPPWRLVLNSKILIFRVLKVSVWWVTCIFCVYGLSINATILPGNVYVNFILSGVAEIPSQIVGYYGMTYYGRKKSLLVSFLGGGLCLLAFAFVPRDLQWLALVLYLVGKFFMVMAIGCVYLYTSELFPTQLRHSLLATCSMVGRIGSILAPQTLLLALYMEQLPYLLYASTCLVSAVLMIGSPETLNLKLPETVQEAENMAELKATVVYNTRL